MRITRQLGGAEIFLCANDMIFITCCLYGDTGYTIRIYDTCEVVKWEIKYPFMCSHDNKCYKYSSGKSSIFILFFVQKLINIIQYFPSIHKIGEKKNSMNLYGL